VRRFIVAQYFVHDIRMVSSVKLRLDDSQQFEIMRQQIPKTSTIWSQYYQSNGGFMMDRMLSKFAKDESGATAIEYGLIAALIAVAIIVALTSVGSNLTATFTSVGTSLK